MNRFRLKLSLKGRNVGNKTRRHAVKTIKQGERTAATAKREIEGGKTNICEGSVEE